MINPVPTEADEAKVLVAYLRLKGYRFFHTPNETGSSMEARRRAVRMKQQGVARGVPDYFIIIGDQLVAVELKRQRGSHTSPEQLEWIEALNDCGVPAKVCNGADAAIEFVETWARTVAERKQQWKVLGHMPSARRIVAEKPLQVNPKSHTYDQEAA